MFFTVFNIFALPVASAFHVLLCFPSEWACRILSPESRQGCWGGRLSGMRMLPLPQREQDRRFFLRMLAIPDREEGHQFSATTLEYIISEAIQILEVGVPCLPVPVAKSTYCGGTPGALKGLVHPYAWLTSQSSDHHGLSWVGLASDALLFQYGWRRSGRAASALVQGWCFLVPVTDKTENRSCECSQT